MTRRDEEYHLSMGVRGSGGASQQGRGESAMSAIRPQTVEVEDVAAASRA